MTQVGSSIDPNSGFHASHSPPQHRSTRPPDLSNGRCVDSGRWMQHLKAVVLRWSMGYTSRQKPIWDFVLSKNDGSAPTSNCFDGSFLKGSPIENWGGFSTCPTPFHHVRGMRCLAQRTAAQCTTAFGWPQRHVIYWDVQLPNQSESSHLVSGS